MTALQNLTVLYEDNHLLVIDKPAGCPTMGAASDEVTIAKLAAAYIKRKYQKPGNVYVGVVSRLDSLVSGVLILARTSKAAARLSDQFREHTTVKHYLAWVEASAAESTIDSSTRQTLSDWVAKNEQRQRMEVVAQGSPGAQLATLSYRTLVREPNRNLVHIALETGRKHQIRVQLSAHGAPVLGDKKYGARSTFPEGIALHCHRLQITHPTRDETLTFTAGLPSYWPRKSQEVAAGL